MTGQACSHLYSDSGASVNMQLPRCHTSLQQVQTAGSLPQLLFCSFLLPMLDFRPYENCLLCASSTLCRKPRDGGLHAQEVIRGGCDAIICSPQPELPRQSGNTSVPLPAKSPESAVLTATEETPSLPTPAVVLSQQQHSKRCFPQVSTTH